MFLLFLIINILRTPKYHQIKFFNLQVYKKQNEFNCLSLTSIV